MILTLIIIGLIIGVTMFLDTMRQGHHLSTIGKNFAPPYRELGLKIFNVGFFIHIIDMLMTGFNFYEITLLMKIGNLLVVCGLGIVVLAYAFSWLYRRYQLNWLHYILLIGTGMTTFMSYIICTYILDFEWGSLSMFDYLTNILVEELFFLGICLGLGIALTLCLIFTYRLVFSKPFDTYLKPSSSRLNSGPSKVVKKDLLQHYKDAGLSDTEIQCFREQMAESKQHILQVATAFEQNAKLRAIETRHNTVKVCQSFFKEIVQQPNDLSKASHFLYKLLPSLKDLLDKYNEINGHVAKNNQTFMILDKTAQTIEQITLEINEAYITFHQDDYNDLDDEIKLAQHNLGKSPLENDDDIFDFNLNNKE